MKREWLKGFWYVVGEPSEVTLETQPVRKTLLGMNIALFLDKQGNYRAVNDICPHMGAQLSLGKVTDGCLQCPYHHFAYNGDGECEIVPAFTDQSRISPALLVDSYPVVSKYGMLWVYLGDEPEDKRPPIVDIPEFNDPNFRPLYSKYTWECSLRPLLENLIDFTHFSYLHGNTFGNADHPFRDNYDVVKSEYEVSCRVKVKFNESIPVFPPVPELGPNPDIDSYLRFCMPTVVVNSFEVGPYKDVTLFHFTPIDDNTVVFGMMGVRNFEKTETADERLKNLGNTILEEDRLVLASCTPEVLPGQAMIGVDKYLVACRRLYDSFLKAGHDIDRHVFPTARGKEVTVLPSPVRRANPMFARRWEMKENQVHGVVDAPASGTQLPVTNGCSLAKKPGGCGGACGKARAKKEAAAGGEGNAGTARGAAGSCANSPAGETPATARGVDAAPVNAAAATVGGADTMLEELEIRAVPKAEAGSPAETGGNSADGAGSTTEPASAQAKPSDGIPGGDAK